MRTPVTPYTIGLLGSVPRLDEERPEQLTSIEGMPPDMIDYPSGCPFYARCTFRIDKCLEAPPDLREVGPGHKAACIVDVTATLPTSGIS